MACIQSKYLEAISRKDPALAIHLEALKESGSLQSLEGGIDDLSELAPAGMWFIDLDFLGQAGLLKQWLSKSLFHRLVLVAAHLQQLHQWLLTSPHAELVLLDQVDILLTSGDRERVESELRKLIWNTPNFRIDFFDPQERFESLKQEVQSCLHQRLAVITEITKYGKWNWPNILRRLIAIEKEKDYFREKLWEKVPILICGGGPSVDAVAEELRAVRDYFFVISAGTGMNVLQGLGVEPHLAMTVDPFRAQFSRFCLVNHVEQLHAAGWRSNYRALSCLCGPRYLLPGSSAYPMTRVWQEELGLEMPLLDEGHNVVGMAMAVAKSLSAASIGLVGIDLALQEGKLYGAGMSSTEKRWQGYSELQEPVIMARGASGGQVATYAKWLAEAKWLSQFADAYEGELYRVGHRGLAVEKVACQSLAVEGLVMRDYDSFAWSQYIRQPSIASSAHKTVQELLESFERSLRASELFLEEKSNALRGHLQHGQIDEKTGPSREQIQQGLPIDIELELDEISLDIEMLELYPSILQIWSQCHKRVFESGFEAWSQGNISWLDLWLMKARIDFLNQGIHYLLQECNEAKKGYFHVSDEV